MKHTQEVCPCTHTPREPPQARQGINNPPPNQPPPRAPRRRPTTHVCILYSLYSRPPARKEAWYEGHPHVTKRRAPHATGERTTATTNTHTTNPRAHEEQEVCPHTQGSDKRRKRQKVWKKMPRAAANGDTSEPRRQRAHQPSNRHENHPLLLPSHSIGCQRRGKCGHRQRTHKEQKAANTAERNMSGMREYLMGSPSGKK